MKVVFFAFAFLSTCVVSNCFAAENSDRLPVVDQGMDMANAADWFHTGVSHFKVENYPAALAAFEESYTLNPKASVLYNIAMCHKAQYKYVDAIAAFKKYIDTAPGNAPELTRARAELAFLATQVVELTIYGVPANAEVQINGKKAAAFSPAIVDPGECHIGIFAEGYVDYAVRLPLHAGGKRTIDVNLTPRPAHLDVTCDEPAVQIMLNKRIIGTCPIEADIAPGKWTLTATTAGMQPYAKELRVHPGERLSLYIRLADISTDFVKPDTRVKLHRESASIESTDKDRRAVRGWGQSLLIMGAAGIAFGTAWAVKGRRDHDQIEKTADDSKRQEYDNTVLPRNNAILTTGFVVGATALTVGVVLLLADRKSHRQGQNTRQSRPQLLPYGASITF